MILMDTKVSKLLTNYEIYISKYLIKLSFACKYLRFYIEVKLKKNLQQVHELINVCITSDEWLIETN